MSTCLLAGAMALTLSAPDFTLEWTHSIEHVVWREFWRVEAEQLSLTGAAIKGSGAGMEPGPDAVLRDGWWVWTPDLAPQRELLLAASGATGGGWRICDSALACHELGVVSGEAISLRPCPASADD
ncbi:DUF1850 domain-containing protein [Paracoccus sp. R12_1]|uniref:DUF1850 domain-containing protein n=1 Tax=unclassified Paracoccus (in: a-proteobacteria) TaxID=2688777 RepID=UPI001ADB0C74|nr:MULTISPECIES: DUF1850 domain-containing protein [unclassified Paracoccus (in: a-proteobacteria)]MBO9454318.1 DUF1850 domain-containing protein [Paracoccus sp. R12_2]MBO9485104.1 DUF1850 domain-containing protein [Paracoccus sp. R12_1]